MSVRDEHEIYRLETSSSALTFSGGALKTKESVLSSGHGVRVLHDGRLGFGYCQHEKEIKKALAQARNLSRFSVKSRFSFAPASRFQKTKTRISDPALASLDFSELREFVDEVRGAAESLGAKSRVMLSSSGSSVKLENTEGFSGAYKKTDFSVYTESMHDDGFGFAYMASNTRPAPSQLRNVGLKAAEMAKAMRGAKKPESGKYTVVLELEALESLLDVLLSSFSGDWKRRRMTKVETGKKMFSEQLTIKEDGLAAGTEARPFDDEGTPSRTRPLIERGVVSSFLFDRETAALAKTEASGACSRSSYYTPPTIGQSNIVLSPGKVKNLDELGRHIEIHYMHGAHTANATTGDFGLDVSVAFLVGGGGRGGRNERIPIRGFILSGNVFDIFNNIEAMERDVRTLSGLIAPRIAFRDVRVVA